MKARLTRIAGILLLAVGFLGCTANVTDVQTIEIDNFSSNDKNKKLAEDLIYYDPRYLAFKISAFDDDTSQGITRGYSINTSDGSATYKVTYNLEHPGVVSKLSEIKEGFERFIPELAAVHASKESLFVELEPAGRTWAESLFTAPASDVLANSSTLLKKSMTAEKFAGISAQLATEYGKPSEFRFVRAQYYEEFPGVPESVSLFYTASFSGAKALMMRISMHQQDQEWMVMGFLLQPI